MSRKDFLSSLKMGKEVGWPLVGVCLLFMKLSLAQQIDHEPVKGINRDEKGGIKYANLIEDKDHYLNVSKVGSALVHVLGGKGERGGELKWLPGCMECHCPHIPTTSPLPSPPPLNVDIRFAVYFYYQLYA